MRPTAAEVLDAVICTFDEQIAPHVTDELARSLSLTVSNLLRHVRQRMEWEPPALVEDNAELHGLLEDVKGFVLGHADLAPLVGQERFAAALHAHPSPSGDLAALTDEATTLRWALCDAIEAIQRVRHEHAGDPDFAELQGKIWNYLDRSLAREAKWIEEAFTGPRR